MSEALWVAEGFTQYYGSLLQVRSGALSDTDFIKDMAGLVNAKISTPGGQLYTPGENSQRAVFVDAGVSVDQTNYPNMFTSYYSYGGAIALALDLELRSRFKKSQDDLMRELWRKHGKPEIPYTIPDVQTALATVTNKSYAADFFRKYVYGHEAIDYRTLFSSFGYSVSVVNPGKPSLGRVSLDSTENGVVIAKNTIRNTPLYIAGLDIGDSILDVDDRKIKSPADLDEIVNKHTIGDKIEITYLHHQKQIKATVMLTEDPWLKIEKQSATLNQQQVQLQKEWIGDAVGSKGAN